jgi:peptide deformylase
MTLLAIVEKGDPILEKRSEHVIVDEITGKKVQKVISDMQETLNAISDGVGLAAPQVGIDMQIFIVSRRVMAKNKKEVATEPINDLVCINPKIIKFSKAKKWMAGEGCLSVRWWYGKVQRSTNVSLEYYDEFGKKQVRGAGGLLAHIFQHECDHLHGELFIDKAKDVEWLEPEDEVESEKK